VTEQLLTLSLSSRIRREQHAISGEFGDRTGKQGGERGNCRVRSGSADCGGSAGGHCGTRWTALRDAGVIGAQANWTNGSEACQRANVNGDSRLLNKQHPSQLGS
jgi:hypothetical protein